MLRHVLAGPFPRGGDLILTLETAGHASVNVPRRINHYLPRTIGPTQTRFRAGPGCEGSAGVYELGLNVLAACAPIEADGEEPVVLRESIPAGLAVREVSLTARQLHREFADEVLAGLYEERSVIPARRLYRWISARRPHLAEALLAPPAAEPEVPF